jgi:phage portal protein BeeE
MLNTSYNKSFCTLLALAGLFLLLPLTAMGETVAMKKAVEADSISVRMNGGAQTGAATVTGCSKCPLALSIDASTQFFHNGVSVERRQIRSLSGKSGTAVYTDEDQHVIKIQW